MSVVGEVRWSEDKDKYLLSCSHPLYMNKSYTKMEHGQRVYCFRCLTETHVRYPRMVSVSGMPADEYWWCCLTPHCRKRKPQRTGQSSQLALRGASLHVSAWPQHRLHVVDLLGNVTAAFGRDQAEYVEEALPF